MYVCMHEYSFFNCNYIFFNNQIYILYRTHTYTYTYTFSYVILMYAFTYMQKNFI